MIEFLALGGLTITVNGDEWRRGPRQRRLMAMLLIARYVFPRSHG
jgi:hypothetical protein